MLLIIVLIVELSHYYYEADSDVIYIGGTLSEDCHSKFEESLKVCEVPPRLADNVTLEGREFNISRFMGWRGDFDLMFQFVHDTHITRVDFYFYNSPKNGYGLPPVKLAIYSFDSLKHEYGTTVQVSFANNAHLSITNDSVTVVSIIVFNDPYEFPYQFFRLSFDASSTIFNRTFISEVKLMNETGM